VALLFAFPAPVALVCCGLVILLSLVVELNLAVWPYMVLFISSSMLAFIWQQFPNITAYVAKFSVASIACFILMIPLVMTFWLPLFDPKAQTDLSVLHGFIWIPRNFSYIYALLWAPVVFACLIKAEWTRFLASRHMRYIGKVSFGLYLLHPVVIVGLQSIGLEYKAIGGLIVLASSIAVAAIAYHVIEDPARIIGYRWVRRLVRSEPETTRLLVP